MGKARYYWHFSVRTMIINCWKDKEYKLPMEQMYHRAICTALEHTLTLENGELRKYAVEQVLFKGRSRRVVGCEIYYNEWTVQNWVNQFIRDVGYFVGK